MDEHDDDLESNVVEEGGTETETFADTADDFNDELFDDDNDEAGVDDDDDDTDL